MPNITTPELSVIAYPASAIPQKFGGFSVADVLGSCMNLGLGDSAGLSYEAINPTISLDWLGGGAHSSTLTNMTGVDFVRFLKDGQFREGASFNDVQQGDISGFILTGRIALLDCKVGSTTLDGGNTDIAFTAQQGTWKTVLPPDAPQRTRIVNTGSDSIAIVRTTGNQPANRSFQFDLKFSQISPTGPLPAFRSIWGINSYSIMLRHGQTPTVEKYVNGSWSIWRRLDGANPSNLSGGHYTIRVRRIAGYLVITINGRSWWFAETAQQTLGQSNQAELPREVRWAAGNILFACQNVRAQISLSLIKYSQANGTLFEGSFSRVLVRKTPVTVDGDTTGETSGWRGGGSTVAVAPSVGGNTLEYTCTMTAGPDGIDSPFVTKILCRFAQEWTNPLTTNLQFAGAVDRATISLAQPPLQPGAQAELEVDRNRLDSQFPTWETYIQDDHPIEIQARWRYEDGTYGSWQKLFKGYVYQQTRSTSSVNERSLRLVCRDPIMRLQEENARIDYEYPPLDVPLIAQADNVNPAIYGADCVKEILNLALGTEVGDSLNGTGEGLRYFPDSHYPLMGIDNDVCGYFSIATAAGVMPPTQNDWFFPPPFDEDALTWINQIAQYDGGAGTIFYYGWPDSPAADWPVPIYGRLLNIIAGRPTHVLPDNAYTAGDVNKLLLEADVETRHNRRINTVVAYADTPGQSDLGGMFPALRAAVARLDPTDINAPEKTWAKKMIVRDNFGLQRGGVEAIAMGTIVLLRNRKMEWPHFVTRGNGAYQWGDYFTTRMDGTHSDTSIGLDGQTFRAEYIQHDITNGIDKDWKTQIWPRPLSAIGW